MNIECLKDDYFSENAPLESHYILDRYLADLITPCTWQADYHVNLPVKYMVWFQFTQNITLGKFPRAIQYEQYCVTVI